MRSALLFATTLAFVLPGCADAPSTEEGPAASTPTAAEPTADAETGSIAGVVVDEEQQPVARADVSVLDVGQSATDADGAFTFNGVPPGDHKILVAALGYEPAARKVTVVAGEVAELRFVLAAILIEDAYHESFSRVGTVTGQWTVNYLQNLVNNTQLDNVLCGPCQWLIELKPKIVDAHTDVYFKAGVGGPGVNEVIIMAYNKATAPGAVYDGMASHEFKANGEAYRWSETQVKATKGVTKARLQLHGPDPDHPGIVFQQKVELWQTWGFGQPLPEDFTLLPPR